MCSSIVHAADLLPTSLRKTAGRQPALRTQPGLHDDAMQALVTAHTGRAAGRAPAKVTRQRSEANRQAGPGCP